jgi:2-amino-4-hydroxy-6-hydroxymethyldihydropteridine diphosphokinase
VIFGPLPAGCAVVALGSNLGDSAIVLRSVLAELERLSCGPFRASSLWRSAPVDCPPGSPPFLNAVCLWYPTPDSTPESLLDLLQGMERRFGRVPKTIHNEPRPLDLDLIAFGQRVLHQPRLNLPHPRAHQRRFVLAPLQEIAPGLQLPGTPLTVSDLLLALGPDPGDTVPVQC